MKYENWPPVRMWFSNIPDDNLWINLAWPNDGIYIEYMHCVDGLEVCKPYTTVSILACEALLPMLWHALYSYMYNKKIKVYYRWVEERI